VRLPAPAPRSFERRHNSITPVELEQMLSVLGYKSLDALIDATVPADIRREVRRSLAIFSLARRLTRCSRSR